MLKRLRYYITTNTTYQTRRVSVNYPYLPIIKLFLRKIDTAEKTEVTKLSDVLIS